LEQAGIDAKALLSQSGIDAEEREAADKLQKLILGERRTGKPAVASLGLTAPLERRHCTKRHGLGFDITIRRFRQIVRPPGSS